MDSLIWSSLHWILSSVECKSTRRSTEGSCRDSESRWPRMESEVIRGVLPSVELMIAGLARAWAPTTIGYSAQGFGKFGYYEIFKNIYGSMLSEVSRNFWFLLKICSGERVHVSFVGLSARGFFCRVLRRLLPRAVRSRQSSNADVFDSSENNERMHANDLQTRGNVRILQGILFFLGKHRKLGISGSSSIVDSSDSLHNCEVRVF